MDDATQRSIRKLLADTRSTRSVLTPAVREGLKSAVAMDRVLSAADRGRIAEAAGAERLAAQIRAQMGRSDDTAIWRGQIREIVERSKLSTKLTPDVRIALADTASQALSWDAVAETAEALKPTDRADLEQIYETASEELLEIATETDDDASPAPSSLTIATAAVYARIVVATAVVMLVRWTNVEFSQESQAILDLALELLGLAAIDERQEDSERSD